MRKVIFYKLALFSVAAVITNFLYYEKGNHKSIIFFVVYIKPVINDTVDVDIKYNETDLKLNSLKKA